VLWHVAVQSSGRDLFIVRVMTCFSSRSKDTLRFRSCNGVGNGQLEQDTSLKTRVIHEIVEALGIGQDARAFDERASDSLLTLSDKKKRRHSQADEGKKFNILQIYFHRLLCFSHSANLFSLHTMVFNFQK
jgi:hypothetical protein